MSETTLTFTYRRNGVPVDVTSAVFRDPTDSYGVRRTDTNAVVVAAGVALDHDGTGQYSYTFTDPAPDLTYEYYIEWVYNGLTNRAAFTKTASGGGSPAVGRYASQADVEDVFGVRNVLIWSQLDGSDDAADLARLQRALDYADAKINAHLNGGPYKIPVTPGSVILRDWAAKLAGVWLYQSRGYPEDDEPKNSYIALVEQIEHEMGVAKAGGLFLDADLIDVAAPTAPTVVL